MTSAQLMSPGTGRCAAMVGLCVFLCGFTLPSSCSGRGRLTTPTTLSSPAEHTRLWAVVPFANESGVSTVNPFRIADAFTQQLEQVRGIQMVAVNRVVNAMRIAEIQAVSTPADALNLIEILGVDALVVGTVTAYDPYRPMTLGLAVQLFARPPAGRRGGLDTRTLTHSTGLAAAPGAFGPAPPVASAAGVFEAANHRTLRQLTEYAVGRTEPSDPAGLDLYLLSMDWYAQFVCYRLLHDLLLVEPIGPDPVADSSPVNR